MFSAMGLLTADLFHDYIRALVERADDIDPEKVESCFLDMEEEGRETLMGESVTPGDMRFHRQLDLRYLGQAYELTVDSPDHFDAGAAQSAVAAFHRRHLEVYGYSAIEEPVEFVNIRLRAVGFISKPSLKESPQASIEPSPLERRLVYFEGKDAWIETPVYKREAIRTGCTLKGPAVVEQYDATTVIYPSWGATVDGFGNMVLRRGDS